MAWRGKKREREREAAGGVFAPGKGVGPRPHKRLDERRLLRGGGVGQRQRLLADLGLGAAVRSV